MPFPDSPRVVYRENPLIAVICQLRFTPILRIVAELPAKYQEAIRHEYPLFEEKIGTTQQLTQEMLKQIPQELMQFLPNIAGAENKKNEFRSLDGHWVITLAKDFIALTGDRYTRWEEFEQHLSQPFETLVAEYKPAVFTRIGLRDQNVIKRSSLHLTDVPWSQLLQPHIAGVLATDSFDESHVNASSQTLELDLIDALGTVTLRHGLAVEEGTGEVCYLIDSDFYTTEQRGSEDVFQILHNYNSRARRLFRWCIKDRLHYAMGPVPL